MSTFKKIGIICPYRNSSCQESLEEVILFFDKADLDIVLEKETAAQLGQSWLSRLKNEKFPGDCDLIVVVGGDGSMLQAAHAIVDHDIPVVGINRGYLGFLTDLTPGEIEKQLTEILEGNFEEEQRFLLSTEMTSKNISLPPALNDVVLLPGGESAHMIEFEISINHQFVCNQRADGLIVATPTGSTAYALSAGGPILSPNLNAIALVPMFPHRLTSRPIVVDGNSTIEIKITNNTNNPGISIDGLKRVDITEGNSIVIQQHKRRLRLIHPHSYRYFDTLRSKLHWESSVER